jgi:hypothetical protein
MIKTALCVGFLLPALVVVSGQAPSPARRGPVRTQSRAVADAGGPFNALGATLFWGAWGYKFDRPRLDRNLEALNAAGVDYIRVLGSVGGGSWQDREVDPRWPDYEKAIAGLTDLAYDRYGMRVQWTLFGGAPFNASAASRTSVVDRFAAMARGREHKIFAFEIANEAWQNGFDGPDGIAELRRLGKRLNDRTAVLVALSAPATGAICDTYARSGVQAMTIHYPRQFGDKGPTTPMLLPWMSLPLDKQCRNALPQAVLNNEPIGPESSVNQDDDPSRIAGAYVMTFLAGHAAYVLHMGPGIRGGGPADLAQTPPRSGEFTELPAFQSIATALAAARRYLPAGLANWTRHEPNAPGAPLHGFGRLYTASSGSRFVALAVDVGKGATLRTRVGANITIRDAATGKVLLQQTMAAGDKIPLEGGSELVVIGRGT